MHRDEAREMAATFRSPGMKLKGKKKLLAEDSKEVVEALRTHYEAIIRDLVLELKARDLEISRLKEGSHNSLRSQRGTQEDEPVAGEASTRVATREEDFPQRTQETEKLRTQLAETTERLSTYRDKYYRALMDIDRLEDRLKTYEKPAKGSQSKPNLNVRKTPSMEQLQVSKRNTMHRPTHSVNSSSIAYLVPEPEVPELLSPITCMTSQSPVARKTTSRPKLRYECRSYIPSFTRLKKERVSSPEVREEQTDPVRASYQEEGSRPDSRFADEFPEENELE